MTKRLKKNASKTKYKEMCFDKSKTKVLFLNYSRRRFWM